jgi:predicted RND superfamily exporter protein
MQAIMITRLYAMYQKSRNMLIFLTVFLTAVTIACGVMIGMLNKHTVVGKP